MVRAGKVGKATFLTLAGFGSALFYQAAGFGSVVWVFFFKHGAQGVGLGFARLESVACLNVCVFGVRHWFIFLWLF